MPFKEIARELQGKAANLAVRMPIAWINILAGPSVAVDGRTLDGRTDQEKRRLVPVDRAATLGNSSREPRLANLMVQFSKPNHCKHIHSPAHALPPSSLELTCVDLQDDMK